MISALWPRSVERTKWRTGRRIGTGAPSRPHRRTGHRVIIQANKGRSQQDYRVSRAASRPVSLWPRCLPVITGPNCSLRGIPLYLQQPLAERCHPLVSLSPSLSLVFSYPFSSFSPRFCFFSFFSNFFFFFTFCLFTSIDTATIDARGRLFGRWWLLQWNSYEFRRFHRGEKMIIHRRERLISHPESSDYDKLIFQTSNSTSFCFFLFFSYFYLLVVFLLLFPLYAPEDLSPEPMFSRERTSMDNYVFISTKAASYEVVRVSIVLGLRSVEIESSGS